MSTLVDTPQPPEPAPAAASAAASLPARRPVPKRQSVQGGRFARWHQPASPPPEEDSWLITYLDVMTLLLVMMVVMLAFSEPAGKKSKEAAAGASAPLLAAVAPAGVASAADASASEPVSGAPPVLAGGSLVPPFPAPADRFEHLPLEQVSTQVEVIKSSSSVRFRISNEMLFASGEASLTPQGLSLLDGLLPTFNLAVEHNIVVEGHTDNTPINTARFPSNWELAAGRAGSVVRHLQSRGLNPTRLSATGYADTRPIESNRTPEGRRANRRVELILELPRDDG